MKEREEKASRPVSAKMSTGYSPSILSSFRPWTFSASLTPVMLGAVLSYRVESSFDPLLFILTVGAVLAVNGAGNMVNSYFEQTRQLNASVMAGINRKSTSTQTLGNGIVKEKEYDSKVKDSSNSDPTTSPLGKSLSQVQLDQASLVNYAASLYGFGMLCMLLLMSLSSAKSELIAALFFGGLSSSFIYTGGIGLKYYILGDLLVVFTFGPLSVLFSYGIQTGTFQLGPLLLALPLSLSTEAILHSKHLREVHKDKQEGVISLAVLLGKQGSYFLFTLLLFFPYLVFVVMATQYSAFLGLPLLTMPVSFKLERALREKGPSKEISFKAALLNTAITLLFMLACLLATGIPFIQIK